MTDAASQDVFTGKQKIGFLVDYLHGYQEILWHTANKTALDIGSSIITFVGQSFLKGSGLDIEASNFIYTIAKTPRVSSYLISGASLGSYVSAEEFKTCLRPFLDKPCISIGPASPGIPAVTIDNQSGIVAMVKHLVHIHGKRKFAFISGPSGSTEALERLTAVRNTLKAEGLELDENCIVNGNFWYNGGEAGIIELLDKRKVTFDAVMAANDFMAIGALHELQRRGIRVPESVSLTGYDNIPESLSETPTLATITAPTIEQTGLAVKYLSAGRENQLLKPLPTEIMPRRSCGCSSVVEKLASRSDREYNSTAVPTAVELAADIRAHCVLGLQTEPQIDEIAARFLNTLKTGDWSAFIDFLMAKVKQDATENTDLEQWHNLLSVLRFNTLPGIVNPAQVNALETAIGTLRVVVSGISSNKTKATEMALRSFEEKLGTSMKDIARAENFPHLGKLLTEQMTLLGMKSFYFALREDILDAHEQDGWLPTSPVLLYSSYRDGKDILPAEKQIRFPALDFLPSQDLPARPYAIVAFPITFQNLFFGYAAYESGPQEGSIYIRISDQIGATVHSILLLERSKKAEKAIASRSAAIEALARPMGTAVMTVSAIVEKQARTVEAVGTASAQTRLDMAETRKIITEMATGMQKVSEFVAVIEDISERIKMLGLNAAIEAARAGMQGKGFGVIASEIRKLADSTNVNAAHIGSVLKSVNKDVSSAVEAATRSQDAFSALDKDIGYVLGSLNDIAGRMESLAGSSSELLKTM